MNQVNISYGSQKLDFSVVYSPRKTISISVYPDLHIEVKSPDVATENQIKKKVLKKGSWIIKQIDYFESFLPRTPVRKFVSGESHKYLGKQYQLKVVYDEDESVKMQTGYIVVKGWDTSPIRVRQLLTRWYYNHAKKKITERYQDILPSFKKYNLEPREIRFKRMATRWGSHSQKAIVLNPELIKAPVRCIDYVVIHEFCHLKHDNHGAKFHQMLEIMMPDWKKWKKRLEESMV
jgi:predicted metal-dependent hydrolase